jgi:hypothetical protein
VRANNLNAATDEQGDEEKVEEVGQSYPQRKSGFRRGVYRIKQPAFDIRPV